MSAWMSVVKFFFSNHYFYNFSPILRKLGTRDLCTNTGKTVEQVFEILILNFLAIFFVIFGLSLQSSNSRAT